MNETIFKAEKAKMHIGQVVCLKSGGPKMTVIEPFNCGSYMCRWFNDKHQLNSDYFGEKTIVASEPFVSAIPSVVRGITEPAVDWEKVAERLAIAQEKPWGLLAPSRVDDFIRYSKEAVSEYLRQTQRGYLVENEKLDAMKPEPFYWNKDSWLSSKTAKIQQEVEGVR